MSAHTPSEVNQEARDRAERVAVASEIVREALHKVMDGMDDPTKGATGAYVMTTLVVWLHEGGVDAGAIHGMVDAAIQAGSGVFLCDPSEAAGAPKPSLIEPAPKPEMVGDLPDAQRDFLLSIRSAASEVAIRGNEIILRERYTPTEGVTFVGYLMTNFAVVLRRMGLDDAFIRQGFEKALETGRPVAMAAEEDVGTASVGVMS